MSPHGAGTHLHLLRHPRVLLPAAALPHTAGRRAPPLPAVPARRARGTQRRPCSCQPGPRPRLGIGGRGGRKHVRSCGPHGPPPTALRGRPSPCGRVRRQGEAFFPHHQPLPISPYLLASPTVKDRSVSLSSFSSTCSDWLESYTYFFGYVAIRCIPFRYKYNNDKISDDGQKKLVEVLMINSQSGPGLLFPKGGWENDETVEEAAVREAIEEAGVRGDLVQLLGFYEFKSRKLQDEFSPGGMCRAAVFALHVKEELTSWPEQSTRQRRWLTVPEAAEQSRHPWVQEALVTGFSVWLENWSNCVCCPNQSKR